MGDSSEVKYQNNECGVNKKSKIMAIKQEPKSVVENKPILKHVSKNAPLDKSKKYPERATKKRLKEQKFRMLKRQFKREKKRLMSDAKGIEQYIVTCKR